MYPIKLGFDEALSRIERLLKNGHSAEALVTSVFTLEKLMRRSLRAAVLSRGFTSKHADELLGRKGFVDLREVWVVFDKNHKKLPELVGNELWQYVPNAVEMRNSLVHGSKVYALSKCEISAKRVVDALKKLHKEILKEYGIEPWHKLPGRRKSRLQWLRLK